jgi:NitT/TauT family transport system substrate-binding protein
MRRLPAAALAAALLASGCVGSVARARGTESVLRLGVFRTLTHAPAYVGLGTGIFERALAPTKVEVTYFNSGSDAGTALLAGSIDATYIGPGPTAALYVRSGKVAVVSGAVAGGAAFVVRTGSGITRPADLRGRRIAVPAFGNTQDIALRTWMHDHGLRARDEDGDVGVVSLENAELVESFRRGNVDGAWVPEPWPSLLISEHLATPFLDERTLWPGPFVTTNLLVSTIYREAHAGVVERLVRANVEAIRSIHEDPVAAREVVRRELAKAGAPALSASVLARAWTHLRFTWDPLASSLREIASRAGQLGYLDLAGSDILGLYRLQELNTVLDEQGLPGITFPT